MGHLIKIEELSRLLSIPKGSLYNLVSQKRIPFVKIGRRLLFDVDKISEWIEEHSEPVYTNLERGPMRGL